MTYQQRVEVAQPGEGPLHFPTLEVAGTDLYRTSSFGPLALAAQVGRGIEWA